MATRYALQHRTSRRFASTNPTTGAHVETPHVDAAFTWGTMTEGVLAQFSLGDFSAAWDVVPVLLPDADYPVGREGPRS